MTEAATLDEESVDAPRAEGRPGSTISRRHVIVAAIWAALIIAELVPQTNEIAFAIGAAGTFAAIVFGVRRYAPSRRWPWWAILSALVLFIIGMSVRFQLHTLGNLTRHRSLIPDLITIPGYAVLGAGLIGFALAKTARDRRSRVIIYDGVVVALAALAISWVYVIEPILSRHNVPVFVRLLLVAYPAFSLFLMVVTVQIAYGSGRVQGSADRFLSLALISMFVGDTLYMLAEIHVFSPATTVLDLPYIVAFLAAATGALDPSMIFLTESGRVPVSRWTRLRLSLFGAALLVPPFLILATLHDAMSERVALFVIVFGLSVTAVGQILQAMRTVERSESRLMHQALHDELTGYPNRRYVERQLQLLLAQLEPGERNVSVLFFDLDRFKLINDSLGHTQGDELLVQVAERLKENVRPSDVVARIGGDEFLIVLGDDLSLANARQRANDLRECLEAPFTLEGAEFFVTASIGLACVTPDGRTTPDLLIRNADTAMYQAKEAGRDAVAVYVDEMGAQLTERVEIERGLRHAVAREELGVVFQPIVRLGRAEVLGVEALVRWTHPTLGVLQPGRFIPIAEESELIGEIGTFVLEEALRQIAVVRVIPRFEKVTVSVNLAAQQLRDDLLVQRVGDALDRHGLPGSALTLEIVETEMMRDPDLSVAILSELRRLGVRIAVDDFGVEYSSLAYLQRLPVDVLKIDRSFVQGLEGEDSPAASLVAAIISMANSLSIQTVVEGVETAQQARKLTELGAIAAQGFLFARPARRDQLLDVLELLTRWLPYVPEEFVPEPVDLPPRLEIVR